MSWEPVSAEQAATLWKHTTEPELWAGQDVITGKWTVQDEDGNILAVVPTFLDVQRVAA